MIEEPERYAEEFKDAGADILTVHIEACRHLIRVDISPEDVGPVVARRLLEPGEGYTGGSVETAR